MEAWCGWVALAHNPLQGTLQSHEWLPFSLFTLQISRTKAALAPLIKQLHSLWGSRVFLSTESFKTWTRHSCEHCHQQLVTGHQQFVIVFMPAIPPSLWPMVSDFYRWAWVLFSLAQEWYFCISIKKHLALAGQEIAWNGWKMKSWDWKYRSELNPTIGVFNTYIV